ncbi:unnamed protein product [Ectocarpus sp. CCAP 1310/34]|nr:unnamed protein product [Ectocarpus sp. CCAP 1310/34]
MVLRGSLACALVLLGIVDGFIAPAFIPPATAGARVKLPVASSAPTATIAGAAPRAPLVDRRSRALTMTANKAPDQTVIANAVPLTFAAGCSAVASAVAEISPHAAAFVQLVCLSIWLGMSVYATFIWPVITGLNMRDSSEFASLLGKLGPSYLQLSVAMIMSLGTSSLVIGHANTTQLVILGIALGITLYNAIVLEPSAVEALEEEQAIEIKLRGPNKQKIAAQEDLPKMNANLANFLGAEVLLDFLCILCAVCYAWDLASSITFA